MMFLKPLETSKLRLFAKKLLAVNDFLEKLHLRCCPIWTMSATAYLQKQSSKDVFYQNNFWKISHNPQENSCNAALFLESSRYGPATLIKTGAHRRYLLVNFTKFPIIRFLWTPLYEYFCYLKHKHKNERNYWRKSRRRIHAELFLVTSRTIRVKKVAFALMFYRINFYEIFVSSKHRYRSKYPTKAFKISVAQVNIFCLNGKRESKTS